MKTLTKEKPHWQWVITQEVSGSIYSNVNQVIYFSLTIYSLGCKVLASIVFEILCWQGFIHIFSKGHYSGKARTLDEKKKHVSAIFSWIHIWYLKNWACTAQKWGYASKRVQCKMPKMTKGHNSRSTCQNLFKSSSGHLLITTNLFLKFQDSSFNSFWDILLTRFHPYFFKGP